MSKRMLIIESSDVGAAYTAEAARSLGYEPLFVCNLKHYQADTLAQILREEHMNIGTNNADDIYLYLIQAGIRDVGAVVTFLDSRIEVACVLAQRFYVRGIDPQVLPLKNKSHVVNLIPEYSPTSFNFDRRADPESSLVAFVASEGKIVLKPCKTTGAIGTGFFDRSCSAQDLVDHMDQTCIPEFLAPHLWTAQRFEEGELVSLEGFYQNGRITFLGISGRRRVGQTESVISFPDDARMIPAVRLRMQAACRSLIERSKIGSGYFHIEFIVNEDKALVIDANVGRIGGAGVTENLAVAFNISPVDVFRHVLAVTLDIATENPYVQRSRRSASICYGLDRSAVLMRLENPQVLQGSFHTQILGAGASVPAMGDNNWAWVGIATGQEETIQTQMRSLKIRTNSGLVAACF